MRVIQTIHTRTYLLDFLLDHGKDAVEEIIPSLEGLLDQLHNIKPQQFYENQRKLKLYDIQLFLEELEGKKKAFYRDVDAIINW